MSKSFNITIEEDATFSKLLTLWDWQLVEQGVQATTGETKYVRTKVPIDLTGYTVQAQIRKTFNGDVVQTFSTQVISASNGQVSLGLSRSITSTLDEFVSWGRNYGVSSDQVGLLGYYDVLLVKNNIATRVLQGTVYLSRSATKDPSSATLPNYSIVRSNITSIGSSVDVVLPSGFANYAVKIQYLSLGNIIIPSDGTVNLYRKPTTSFQTKPVGILAATTPKSSLLWEGSSTGVRVSPNQVTGADSYRVTVTCSNL